ncbi:predicted protein [Chaetoceros tenuissimus]|uniref:Uncharacterized protein n=1 Tax=Chaetoceros tenuissimus TaxID=426638 RepID=A0AAD3CDB7_9STRA|nr:predicted protein [Chaetoceros tenuissimus]
MFLCKYALLKVYGDGVSYSCWRKYGTSIQEKTTGERRIPFFLSEISIEGKGRTEEERFESSVQDNYVNYEKKETPPYLLHNIQKYLIFNVQCGLIGRREEHARFLEIIQS